MLRTCTNTSSMNMIFWNTLTEILPFNVQIRHFEGRTIKKLYTWQKFKQAWIIFYICIHYFPSLPKISYKFGILFFNTKCQFLPIRMSLIRFNDRRFVIDLLWDLSIPIILKTNDRLHTYISSISAYIDSSPKDRNDNLPFFLRAPSGKPKWGSNSRGEWSYGVTSGCL